MVGQNHGLEKKKAFFSCKEKKKKEMQFGIQENPVLKFISSIFYAK